MLAVNIHKSTSRMSGSGGLAARILLTTAVWWIGVGSSEASPWTSEGKEVILPDDIETVIITWKFDRPVKAAIAVRNTIESMERKVLSVAGKDQGGTPNSKLAAGSITALFAVDRELIQDSMLKLKDTITMFDRKSRDKRAIEALGSALNWMTGVPTAEDHRKILEQVRVLRLDSEEITQLQKEGSSEIKQVVKKMKTFQSLIKAERRNLDTFAKAVNENGNNLIKTLATITITQQANEVIFQLRTLIQDLKRLLFTNRNKLDPMIISDSSLSDIIDKIYLERKDKAPIFLREDIAEYYQLPLAHTWVEVNRYQSQTLLQIPVAPTGKKSILRVLDPLNTVHSLIDLACLDMKSNSFRYMASDEIRNCYDANGKLFCNRRSIEITPIHGCSLRLANCKVWTNIVVHDLSNVEILTLLPDEMEATVSCVGEKDSKHTLPKRAILTLNMHCSLVSERFSIDKVSFRTLSDFDSPNSPNFTLIVQADPEILATRISLPLENITDIDKMNLETLLQNNAKWGNDIRQQIQTSQSLWDSVSGGQTPTEQIVTWALLTLSLILGLINFYAAFIRPHINCKKQKDKARTDKKTITTEKLTDEPSAPIAPTYEETELQDLRERLQVMESDMLARSASMRKKKITFS
jgi:hypothetical protein